MEWTNTIETLNRIGMEVSDDMREILVPRNKLASKQLYNSIQYQVENRPKGPPTLSVSFAGHGNFVRKMPRFTNKMPPVQVIEKWLLMKKIPIGGGRLRSVGGGNLKKSNQSKTLRSMAWAIAKAIKKRGSLNPQYTPVDFLEPFTSWKNNKTYTKQLKSSIVEDIRNDLKNKK